MFPMVTELSCTFAYHLQNILQYAEIKKYCAYFQEVTVVREIAFNFRADFPNYRHFVKTGMLMRWKAWIEAHNLVLLYGCFFLGRKANFLLLMSYNSPSHPPPPVIVTIDFFLKCIEFFLGGLIRCVLHTLKTILDFMIFIEHMHHLQICFAALTKCE